MPRHFLRNGLKDGFSRVPGLNEACTTATLNGLKPFHGMIDGRCINRTSTSPIVLLSLLIRAHWVFVLAGDWVSFLFFSTMYIRRSRRNNKHMANMRLR